MPDPEDRQRHERLAREPRLDEQERREQHEPAGQRHEHAGRAPAERVGADDPERQADEAGGDEHGAGDVEVAGALGARRRRDQARAERDDDDAERHVHGEDRRPPERLGEDAAEQRARRRAEAADGAPRGQAAVALAAFGERGGDDRQRRRRQHGAAEALDGARGDQQIARVRERACERGQREHRGADEEHAPAAEQVGRAAAEHQEAGERQRVGVDHPLQAGGREMQPGAHRRQRDVDDRDVEDDHELREADDEQERVLGTRGFSFRGGDCVHEWYGAIIVIQVQERGLSW